MLLALHSFDLIVLALYLLGTLGVGIYFSRGQKTTKDFFLAGRTMHWLPVSMSLVVTIFSALSFTGLPAEAYKSGLLMLIIVAAYWLALPIIVKIVIPFYYNLELYTAYEYLELRFALPVRVASSVAFVLWRMLWLGAVLYAPCKVLLFTLGIDELENRAALYGLMIGVGLLTTVYTFLGGMKAVIWTDAAQFCAVIVGIFFIVGCCTLGPDGTGLSRAWEIASQHEMTQLVHLQFSWNDRWFLWGILLHLLLAQLSFLTADQITLQRYLTTRDLAAAKRSMLSGTLCKTVMVPMLVVMGMSLFAFYHDHSTRYEELLRNAPGDALRRAMKADPQFDISSLRPDSRDPHVDTNLVMPYFISHELPRGMAGLILAALFAAAMSSMDSGLNSISTSMIVDFHRRLGIGRDWLAGRTGKPKEQLDEADELALGRPLTLALGIAATGLGILISQVQDVFTIMIGVANTFGGPLLAVFLLGMLSRRVGPRGAMAALILGTLATIWITVAPGLADRGVCAWLWPWDVRPASLWSLNFGFAFSTLVGLTTSWVFDAKPPHDKLDGLVMGVGRQGLPNQG